MPIYEEDIWRQQYFEGIACPADVHIPTDDPDAYRLYPEHRWVYNKLALAESQGLACAPHGVEPVGYPVFSKPIVNLRGMGFGSRVLENREAYLQQQTPGHFWMTLLHGEHISTDIAVIRGDAVWSRHTLGAPLPAGTFDYWTVDVQPRPALERFIAAWIRSHLGRYTGMINVESIGERLIEVHLRFTDQWPDLYGPGWVEAVVRLYQAGVWETPREPPRIGYSVVLFGPHGRAYRHPARELIDAARQAAGVASVQITFHEDRPAALHAMPPGGFRLAVINCWDLEAGKRVRARLAQALIPEDAAAPNDRLDQPSRASRIPENCQRASG